MQVIVSFEYIVFVTIFLGNLKGRIKNNAWLNIKTLLVLGRIEYKAYTDFINALTHALDSVHCMAFEQ